MVDTFNPLLSGLAASLSAVLAGLTLLYSLLRTRASEREQRVMLDQLQFRETELKYEFAVSSEGRNRAVHLAGASLRALDQLEVDLDKASSPEVTEDIRALRRLQQSLLEALSIGDNDNSRHLTQLSDLLHERRSQIDKLPGEEEQRDD
ncbi:hypothetical protein [Microbacterium sp. 16-032]|uniref:hypothetical protein n=1 Tax=Microbacterium sp. 16-032 TaxID=3239808 RepID=UPI0034E1ADE6